MSGDPEQEYFADGITEDIITELSRFSELFVIARNSSFQYKGKSPDVRQVGRELGVRYVLEGSIRRASDRVRITGQLVDATTGAHRWADRYDRKLEDIFSVQDEVARTIVSILASHVNKAEIERTLLKPPRTWQAHDCYMKATSAFESYWTSLNVEDLYETRRFLEQALSIDPIYARAHALLTFTYTTAWVQPLDASYGDPGTLSRALQSGRKAVQLDPFLPAAHAYLAIVLTFSGQHEASIAEHERAIALNPNFSDWTFGADVLKAGDPARAIEVLQRHMRLDPFYVPQALAYLGLAHYMLKQYAKAIPPLRETASRAPNYWRCRAWLTAAYAQSGAIGEARVEAAELLRLRPKFTAGGDLTFYSTIKRREDVEHLVEGIRKAGLPE
jgi:adenylate cyclase